MAVWKSERKLPVSERLVSRKRGAIADVAFNILAEAGRLHCEALLARIVAQGIPVGKTPVDPVDTLLRILRADNRFTPVNGMKGYWMLTTKAKNCLNDLQRNVQLKQEIHNPNETAEGSLPPTASTKKEDLLLMVTTNATTKRQSKNDKNAGLIRISTALGPSDPDDGDIGRQQRGIAIAATVRITKGKLGYIVPSASNNGKYIVNVEDEDDPYCSCDDFDLRQRRCKHIIAVECYLMRNDEGSAETAPIYVDSPESPVENPVAEKPAKKGKGGKKSAPVVMEMPTLKPIPPKPVGNSQDGRNHPAINKAQDIEGDVLPVLLRELCDTIEEPEQKGPGRRRLPLGDMVFAATAKTYGLKSARLSAKAMREAVRNGQMEQVPSFASIMRYLDKPELTSILVSLIEQSAVPLASLETHFSPDGTGFGTDAHDEWCLEKHGEPAKRSKRAKYIKAHAMTGAKTKIVTAVKVTIENSADCPQLPELVETTAKNFTMEEVSADKAYLSHYNFRAIWDAGAVPFIPFKRDSVASNSHHKKDPLWTMLFHFFQLHREEFLEHYHLRSNVETAFSMVKRKFNGYVRTKNPTAQVNEVLTKILCHNIAVLILAMVERKITPTWTPVVEQLGLVD